ncbi:MAG: hypothetical protein K9J42_06550 [Sulfuritalea sp.]|nr:hypothetical protein [Sulfuritalea sp.]
MKFAATWGISLKPSRRLFLILIFAHIAALGAILAATLPSWLTAGLLVAVGASLASMRRLQAVAGLTLHGDGRLETVGIDGTASEAFVQPQTVVWWFLVVLLYRQDGRLRSTVLLADSFDSDDFRQLRIWLRWRACASIAA